MLDDMTNDARIAAFSDELQKIAARAGLKLIRKLVAKGDPKALARAERLAITPGVLKKTQAGSQIKHLGAGMEGVSTLTAHPKRGLEVRKLIDPKGIAGEGMIANREAAGRALRGSSDVAEFRGARTLPTGIREQRFEFVPGKTVDSMGGAVGGGPSTAVASSSGRVRQQAAQAAGGGMTQQQRAQAQIKRLKMQGQQKGFQVADLHEGNVMMGQQGGGKAVDFIPVPKNKDVGLNRANFAQATQAQEAAAAGKRTEYLDYLEDPRRSGNLMARAYAGAPPLTPGSSTRLRQAKMAPKPAPAATPAPRPATPAPAAQAMPSTAVSRPRPMAAKMPPMPRAM